MREEVAEMRARNGRGLREYAAEVRAVKCRKGRRGRKARGVSLVPGKQAPGSRIDFFFPRAPEKKSGNAEKAFFLQ